MGVGGVMVPKSVLLLSQGPVLSAGFQLPSGTPLSTWGAEWGRVNPNSRATLEILR